MVLDTNAFHPDMRADRSLLRSILDEAVGKGAIELFVPEVVLQELDKQFARRSKKVVKQINTALGEHEGELRELGLAGPSRMAHDPDDVAAYRGELEERLRRAGAQILPLPGDLSPAVAWSVNRRKPFKQSGEGFPDAAIWLTVLELAGARDQAIALVTTNTNDFGDGKEPPGLADELRQDLVDRGRPRDQVRLVAGIVALGEEVGSRLESARNRAQELSDSGAFDRAIEHAVVYSRLDQRAVQLGVELDTDPQVTSWDLVSMTVDSAVELPGGELLVEGTAEASLLLDLLVYKADYYLAEQDEDVDLTLTDPDFNDHYVEAEREVVLRLELALTTDLEGSDTQVEIGEVELAPLELIGRALRGSRLGDLLDEVRDEVEGKALEDYTPNERIESNIEQVEVLSTYRGGSAELQELIESEGDRHLCHLEVRIEADVEWVVTAPTPFDADAFASLSLNESSGAPILQGYDSAAPLVVDLTAAWDPEHGWHDIAINTVSLDEGEGKRRAAAGTKADDLIDPLGEDE